MKRRHVLLIFIILSGAYLSAWHFIPTIPVNALVVDKTVSEKDYREHRAIFWIAEHRRFTDPGGAFMRYDSDYLGYHPEDGRAETLSREHLAGVDLLYLADTYGIYSYPEGLEVYEENLPFEAQDVELLSGGLSFEEATLVYQFSLDPGVVIVGEHNIIGYPTYLDQEAAELLQQTFGISYDGWLARYFEDLNEAAFWIKVLYSRIYGLEWSFDSPGMIFIREDVRGLDWYTDLVVVESSAFFHPWPVISNEKSGYTARAADSVPYLYWIEVVEVDPFDPYLEVLAYYELPFAGEPLEALRARGLPDRYPAFVHCQPPGEAERFYFTGDFADQLPALLSPRLAGSAAIQRFFSYFPGMPVEYRFFFQWYEPVLREIFSRGASGPR